VYRLTEITDNLSEEVYSSYTLDAIFYLLKMKTTASKPVKEFLYGIAELAADKMDISNPLWEEIVTKYGKKRVVSNSLIHLLEEYNDELAKFLVCYEGISELDSELEYFRDIDNYLVNVLPIDMIMNIQL
jgi:hypothetical protein